MLDAPSIHVLPAPTTWRGWIDRYAPRFLLYARQQTRREADAEDVLQEALVEAWRRQGETAEPPAPALVYATIRRRAIDQARSTDVRGRSEQTHADQQPTWLEPVQPAVERDLELEAAMKDLTPIYREVVTLKVWGELTFQQIGEQLGIPPNTAASRYRYGLEQLRTLLAKEVA